METATLQIPKTTGRSRFSKALPTPPPAFAERSSSLASKPQQPLLQRLAAPRKPLPGAPSTTSRLNDLAAPLPPPKEGSITATSPLASTVFSTESNSSSASIMASAAAIAPKFSRDSPLPTLPPSTLGVPSSLRSIARRPVGAPISPAQPSPVDSISSLLSAYTNQSDSTQKSLAQTNDSTSTKGSYLDAFPAKQSGESSARTDVTSPPLEDLYDLYDTAPTQEYGDGDRGIGPSREEAPPPPPMKDARQEAPRPRPPPESQVSKMASSFPVPGATSSPPRSNNSPSSQPQIWRRRSLKSDKNLGIADLSLPSRYGSAAEPTTTTSATTTSQNLPSKSLPPPPPQAEPATSFVSTSNPSQTTRILNSLPGRNIRPTARKQSISDSQSEDMGGGFLSKVEGIKTKLAERAKRNNVTEQPEPESPSTTAGQKIIPAPAVNMPAAAARPPSPEYTQDEIYTPVLEQILSPVSPQSSPDFPPGQNNRENATVSQIQSSEQYGRQEQHSLLSSQPPRLNVVVPTADFPVKQIEPMRSRPHLASNSQSGPRLSPAPSPLGPGPQAPRGLPSSPAPSRGPSPAPNQFPARTTSRLKESIIDEPSAAPAPAPQPVRDVPPKGPETVQKPSVSSVAPTMSRDAPRSWSESKGSATIPTPAPGVPISSAPGLAKKEEAPREAELIDHAGAAKFPRNWFSPAPEGYVMDAHPITNLQRGCRHPVMAECGRVQTHHPMACAACATKAVVRFQVCSHCSLRTCQDCTRGLRACKGNIEKLLADGNPLKAGGK